MKDIIMPRSIFNRARCLRRKLMLSSATGAAIGALMLSLPAAGQAQVAPPPNPAPGPSPAGPVGQSFQGTGTFVMGGGSIVQTATQDTITVTSPQAVINWTPNDRGDAGTIDFLPTGLSGLFTGAQDFTVLNRIIPLNGQDVPVARMIALNGNISSQVGSGSGGSVWFYSPGGILVGANSIINVGSLVLTSQDIDTTGGLFGANGEIRFRAPAIGSNGSVEIANGARITAFNQTQNGAYIALVSPRVVQAGAVIADGSVALVAAEVADISINSGLFDINVTVGTGDAHGIIHTGFTGGPSQNGAQPGRTYMVAIPKSQALTMLVSGGIGYETATSAGIDARGNIVLSAGRNVLGGAVNGPAVGAGPANISIEDSSFLNALDASATGSINARPSQSCAPFCSPNTPSGQLLFGGDTRLSGDVGVNVSVGQAQQLIARGSLTLQSARPGQGGSVSLTIDDAAPPSPSTTGGGLVTVSGGLRLDASAVGTTNVNDGAATGGSARLSITGGTLNTPFVSLAAGARGGVGADGTGSVGRGGTVAINLDRQGTLNSSFVDIDASGRGGEILSGGFLATPLGGDKAATLPQIVAMPLTHGGAGFGGTATSLIGNGSTFNGDFAVAANGSGGFGTVTSGAGTGGTAGVTIDNGRFVGGSLYVAADGYGGSSNFGQFGYAASARGGDGTGGTATLTTSGSAPQSSASSIFVSASAFGGNADLPSNFTGNLQGGNSTGGSATIDQSGISILVPQIAVRADATGGNARGSDAANGGNATGGSAAFNMRNSAALEGIQQISVSGDALGGIGVGQSGSGTGGTAKALFDQTVTVALPTLQLTANGSGGGSDFNQQSYAPSTLIGGNGQGGFVTLDNFGTVTGTSLQLDANGTGADARPNANATALPAGGNATGGTVALNALGGTLGFAGISASANATAGTGGNATGRSGQAQGGSIGAVVRAGLTADFLTLNANSSIFDSSGAALRSSTGGGVEITASNAGVLTVNSSLSADVSAVAQGFGDAASSLGATGGNIQLTAALGGTVDLAGASLIANGVVGAAQGTIGDALGGRISVRSTALSNLTIDALSMDAYGVGGIGPSGGKGVGGQLYLSASDSNFTLGANTFLRANGRSGLSTGTVPTPESLGGSVSIVTEGETGTFNFTNLYTYANGDAEVRSSAANPVGSGGLVPADGRGGSTTVEFRGGITAGRTLSIEANGYGGSGGDGYGGSARFDVTGGSSTIEFTGIAASGFGGDSLPGGIGGNGFGGIVEASFTGGLYDGTNLQFFAEGTGGRGSFGVDGGANGQQPGTGGDGRGGFAHLIVGSSGTNAADYVLVSAGGNGGRGGDFGIFDTSGIGFNPGRGGNGFGGSASADLNGGTLSGFELSVSSFARGGDGGAVFASGEGEINVGAFANLPPASGGNALSGDSTVTVRSTTVSNRLSIHASASGGEGGTALAGFSGGDAQGGTAQLIVDGGSTGSLLVDIGAGAFGGRGGQARHGDGGNGGNGFGGTARVQAINGATSTIRDDALHATGTGGRGGNGNIDTLLGAPRQGFGGGQGGEGFGGSTEFLSFDSDLLIAASSSTVGGAMLTSSGVGGSGGNGAFNAGGDPAVAAFGGNGGIGGSGHGGRIQLIISGGSIGTSGGGTLTMQSSGLAGFGGTGGTGIVVGTLNPQTQTTSFDGGDGLTAGDGFTYGGTARVEAGDSESGRGVIDLARLVILNDGDVAGRAELINRSVGVGIHLGSLSVSTQGSESFGGRFDLQLGGSGTYIFSETGQIVVDGASQFTSDGGLFVDALGTGNFTTGSLTASLSRQFVARHGGRPADGVTLRAGSISSKSGWVDFDIGTLVQGTGSFSFDAVGSINFDQILSLGSASTSSLTAGDNITGSRLGAGLLRVSGRDIVIGTVSADGPFGVDSTGNVRLGAASSSDNAIINAGGSISIDSLTASGFSSAEGSFSVPSSISLQAGGDVLLGTLDALGNITIKSASISSRSDESNAATSSIIAGGSVSAITTGDARFGSVSARNINLNAGGLLNFGSLSGTDFLFARGTLGLTGGSASSAESHIELTSGGAIEVGMADAFDNLLVDSSGGGIRLGFANTEIGNATLNAASHITLDGGDIGGTLMVDAGGNAALGSVTSVGNIGVRAGGSISVDSLTTTGLSGGEGSFNQPSSIFLQADGNALLGAIDAAGDIGIFAASISSANDSGGAPTSRLAADGTIRIEATGDVRFGSARADLLKINTSGAVLFVNGDLTDSADVAAAGGITIDTLTTGGLARLTTTPTTPTSPINPVSPGNQRLLSFKLTAPSAAPLAGTGSISLGAGTIGTSLDINAANNVTIGSVSSGGATTIIAGSTVALGALQSGTSMAITSAQLAGAGSSITAGTSLTSTQSGTAQWGSINAVGPVSMTAASVSGASVTTTGTGGTVRIVAPSGITITTIDSAATTSLSAANGAIALTNLRSTGTIDAQGRSVTVTSGNGTLDFAALVATAGDARVTQASGPLVVQNGNASGTLALTTLNGNLVGQVLSGNAIDIRSSGTATLTGAITATNALTIASAGETAINAVATGRTVDIASGNIRIGSAARVGTAGTTTSVHLTNSNGTSRTFVGGDDSTQGYSLSAVEMQRLFGNDITITAPRTSTPGQSAINPARSPDVIVGAFTLQGGGGATANLGSSGTLLIETPGFAQVTGTARVAGAASGNRFIVSANDALQIILGSGALRIEGASGPAGTLRLQSSDIVVATTDAISDIAGLTDTSAIDERLTLNDGIVSDEGALVGGTIELSAINNVLIQNSGTTDSLDDRRGFTTGIGGLSIALDSSNGRLVVNGRVADDLSGYLTGREAFNGIRINGVALSTTQTTMIASIDPISTINGCAISNPAGCTDFVNLYPVQISPLVDDNDTLIEESDGDPLVAIITLDLQEPAPLPNQPLIDEPVTGSGNDDLWVPSM